MHDMQRLQAFKYELMPTGEQQRQMCRFLTGNSSCRLRCAFKVSCRMQCWLAAQPRLSMLGIASRVMPAMSAGIATNFLSFEDVIARIDAAQAPKARGPYKARAGNSN